MISRAPKGRSKVTNGRQLFNDGDARLKVSRRFGDALASIAADLGGVDRLLGRQVYRHRSYSRPRPRRNASKALRVEAET
jgi:hypothetical protein